MHQQIIELPRRGRGLHDITNDIAAVVAAASVSVGLCHVFLQHTSASLVIQENADPDVQHDLQDWFERAVIDGDPRFQHVDEGEDDMSAHVRTALTQTSLSVPVAQGRLLLGTWQAIYLYEHRLRSHARRVVVTVHGG